MLIAGTLLLTPQSGETRLETGFLRLDGPTIAEVGRGRPPGTPDLGGDDCLIFPGFIDAHVHIPQFDAIGADGLPLLTWLDRVIFPSEARWEDPDFAGQMASRVARRLLAAGTTGIAAYGTVHAAGTAAAIRALGDAGLHGCVGQVLMDRSAPPELTRPSAQLLHEAAEQRGHARIEHAVTPRFAVSCTPGLLQGAGDLARRTGAPVQTHLAETPDECALVERLFNGRSYTGVYADAGLLTARSILGHSVWLDAPDDADRRLLAESRAVVAHCPTANLFLVAGEMHLAAHRRAGVRLAVGSDVAGGPEVAMPRVARAVIETAKRHALSGRWPDPRQVPLPSAADAWRMITAGNADALGWPRRARLEPGADADVLVLRPDIPWRPAPDALSMLMYAWDDRWLTHTIANGIIAYESSPRLARRP